MKVRLLQGNQAGTIEEWTEAEARAAIATGWCEAFVPVPAAPAPQTPPKTTRPKATTRRRPPARSR